MDAIAAVGAEVERMNGILSLTADACMVVLFLSAALCLYRVVLGPGAADRAVAGDAFITTVIGMICVLSVRWNSALYFDAVWILTLVGFLGSAAIARYLTRGRLF
jgi:multicomponent K+:H+ antiporter subunit F